MHHEAPIIGWLSDQRGSKIETRSPLFVDFRTRTTLQITVYSPKTTATKHYTHTVELSVRGAFQKVKHGKRERRSKSRNSSNGHFAGGSNNRWIWLIN